MAEKSVLTNDYPAQLDLQTRINAQGKSRIFNTTTYKQPLTLNNVILENGVTTGQGARFMLVLISLCKIVRFYHPKQQTVEQFI